MIVRLLNLVEKQAADLREAQAEIQRLRDEINRLKQDQREHPQGAPSDHSSEKKRRKARPHHKRGKKVALIIHRLTPWRNIKGM